MLERVDADLRIELADPPDRRRAARRIGQCAGVLPGVEFRGTAPTQSTGSPFGNDLGPAVVQIGIVNILVTSSCITSQVSGDA